ncbi:MAG: hypothetical protein ABFS23_07870 [Pseudomonadota bacterium]
MAKTFVCKGPDREQAPFLRGILTRSLVNAGLSFDDAYDMAQEIRSDLKDTPEITTTTLRGIVASMVEKRFGPKQRAAYETKRVSGSDIIVHTPTRSEAFSIGVMTHSLRAFAISSRDAYEGARRVHAALKGTGHKEIDHKALRRVIYRCLREHCSPQVADRYLSWRRFENSGTPLILLIGGVTGSGKSTLATEIGYRLDIGRIQSTDMIREIIRSYLAQPVAPTLQYSSFEAWRGLPAPEVKGEVELENPIITGFLSQLNTLKPALDAAIGRSLKEREHLILEGVHAVPTGLGLGTGDQDGLIVSIMVATMKKQFLRVRLQRRGHEQRRRTAARYLDHIDDIWELQAYLLSSEDSAGTPIIPNWTIEDAIREILELVSAKVMKRFPANPESIEWETD